ncbi:MAG: TolC family protein [Deltaproteobacteria bacterium]|nr:MAG: TolC family protein [Deltaproteobacteria bacterium]
MAPGAAGFASTKLIPNDPAYIEYNVELESAIEKALAQRAELAAAQNQVEDAEVQLSFGENQRLPSLDLLASYRFSGLSGDAKPNQTATVESGFSSSNDSFFRNDGDRSWSLGGEVSIPLPNTSARALVAQRRIELRRARTNLRRVEQSVILEVRGAVRALRSAVDGVEAAERNRLAREEALRAEQEKLRLGDSTPHDVLQFEDDLVDSERQKIAALRTYQNAITGVERNQGTLLETRGISVEDELQRGSGR